MTKNKVKNAEGGEEKPVNTHVGRGMKPRGEQAPVEKPAEGVSTNAGQEQGTEGAPEQPQTDAQTPPSQDEIQGQNGDQQKESLRQMMERVDLPELQPLLEGEKPSSAATEEPLQKDEFFTEGQMSVEQQDKLAVALEQSGFGAPHLHGLVDAPEVDPSVAGDYAGISRNEYRFEFVDGLEAVKVFIGGGAAITFPRVGQRDNGDFGVVIAIPEYFVQPVKDFAEADGGKSVEQWCTEFFAQHLEAYCTPAKGR